MSSTEAAGQGAEGDFDDIDDFDTEFLVIERPIDPTTMAAYVLAFLAVGVAALQGLIQLLLGDGPELFADLANFGGVSAVTSGAVGLLAVALAGLSLVRARSGAPVQEGVARTALGVGVIAVILSLVLLGVQVAAAKDSPLFRDNGSGFSVP